MSKKYSIFITSLFVVFLGVFFVANALSPDKDFSPMENRQLAQRPVASAASIISGEFMDDFEAYVTDQFALRDRWISLKAGSEVLMGKQENNGVYFCDRETLIARFDAPSGDKAVKRLDQNYGYVEKLAENVDVPVYFSLIPGKTKVWADRLPLGAPNGNEDTYLLRGAENSKKATWIDLTAPMMAHKDEEIYYRTDHHWTSLGAYYGYAALMERMGLTPKALSDFTPTVVSEEFFGTTFSSSGARWIRPDVMELYVPQNAATVVNYFDQNPTDGRLYDMSKLAEKDKYSTFLGGNKPLCVIQSTVSTPDAPKLLVVRDSFSDSLAPFLTYNFSEIHLFDPRYNKNSVAQYVKDNGIDMVLVLYSVENFVKDGNLFVLSLPAW